MLVCSLLAAEREQFRGEWALTAVYDRKGDKVDLQAVKKDIPVHEMNFSWGKLTWHSPKAKWPEFEWVIDPSSNPKAIDLHFYDPDRGPDMIVGIYEWKNKDVVRFRFSPARAMKGKPSPRPTSFTPEKEDRAVTLEFTRQPKR